MLKIARFGFYIFGINTYVVYDPETKECAIIDPGMSRADEFDALENFINREGLKVTHLINTHLHMDHAVADYWVKDKYGVPVEAHPDDARLGEMLSAQARAFGIAGEFRDIIIDRNLQDGDIIKIGRGELHVLHVPGHSPGSISLYDKEDRFVISGDVLFQGSIGRSDLAGGNLWQLIKSIKGKLLKLPDETTVFPGHGDATTIGFEKDSNPYL